MTQLLLTGASASTHANLSEALLLVEGRLATWSSNQVSFNDLLRQAFGVPPRTSAKSAALLASLQASGLGISVQILDATTMDGLIAAYTSAAPDGGERIYLNAAWLELATAEQIEAVLLEELGHAIDRRLNGSADTAGDEGAIFSALLRGERPDPAAYREKDQRILILDGIAVAVEASLDTTRPTGSQGSFATAPAYAAAVTNPFGITNVGSFASPAFADADNDGDLDLFIDNSAGKTLFFRNTAAPGSTTPAYATAETNPFGITNVGSIASPAFADADNDGDLDLFIGNSAGNTLFFRNTAAPGSTTPAYATAETNPFGITVVDPDASPAFADADGDGDLDLFIGNKDGDIFFFRNTAAPGSTEPEFAAAETNPFGITDVGYGAKPAFADADGDGDLDLFIGNTAGDTVFFRNTAPPGSTTPAYAAAVTNPLGITGVGYGAKPAFADADGDGALDLFIGNISGNTLFFRNTAPTPVAPVDSTTQDGSYGIGSVINLTVAFSETVVVDITGGTPTLQLETGSTDRKAILVSGSGSSTLTFRYIVQEGDTSADLDQLSSTALELNGGIIADAAGNNAILTLAEPGEQGSLGDNAALVIDTTRPTGSQGSFATAPAYAAAVTNPFGITNVDDFATPAIADADNDGDLDLFIGSIDGDIFFFRNTAAPGSTEPEFAAAAFNPFGITVEDPAASPAFADVDGDGDLDLFIGNFFNILFFRNTAAPGSTTPAYATAETNPFGITVVDPAASPAFADVDGDGDLDLFIGSIDGDIFFFRNTAAPGSTEPEFAAAETNPFGITNVDDFSTPAIADADGDGDLDLFIGVIDGNTFFFRNTAAAGATTPAFAAAEPNPFGITRVDSNASPALADADNDGDLDLVIGNISGNTVFFRNTAPTPIAPVASTTANGSYGIGDVIDLTVTFSEAVVVDTTGGTPTLQLETGTIDRKAIFVSGSGSSTLTFRYTVQEGDTSADLDQLSSTALELNGGSIADAAGNNAILTLAEPGEAGSLGDNAALVIDGVVPTVTGVDSTTADGTYGIGDVIDITVALDEVVFVTGTPTLQLETGTIDRKAIFESGSGSSTLTFRYTVQEGDTSADLDQLSSTALELNGGSIADAAGNNAILTLAEPGEQGSLGANAALVIDTTRPTGSQGSFATAPAFATAVTNPFGITDVDEASPAFADADNDGDLDLFIGSKGGDTFFFRNTAAAGSNAPAYAAAETNPFGITNVGSIASPAFADTDNDGDLDLFIGNGLGLTLFFRNTAALGATSPAFAAAETNPFGITDADSIANPAFADTDNDGDLDLLIGNGLGLTFFSRNTAAPGSTAPAYAAGVINPFGITNEPVFASPAFADADGDGDLDLFIGNKGEIVFLRNTAASGSTTPAYAAAVTNPFGIGDVGSFASPAFADVDNDGDLDLFIGNKAGDTVFFRNTAPTPIAPVASTTANGSYGIGDIIDITVSFSEAVVVDTTGGTPTLQLETGTIDRKAIFESGSGSSTLTFRYTVQEGDTSADLDQLSSTALELNGGSIADAAGNNAILTLAEPGEQGSLGANAALVIDGVVPTVTRVDSTTADGSYGIGSVINLTVAFSETVVVDITGGTPTLQLETGSTDRKAIFVSGSGSTTLTFRYIVQEGDTSADLDQLSSTALELNGGIIADAAGKNAILTLAEPGEAGSLGDNAALVIDTTRPTGSQGSFATAPAYAAAVTNPFGITNVRLQASPTLTDIDGDGDFDLFIGGADGEILFFRNTAALGATSPAFAAAETNPFGITDVADRFIAKPEFADIDRDGDLDLFIGDTFGSTFFFRNTGSADTPAFIQEGGDTPFGIPIVINASPAFADADGDGDLDLFIGNSVANRGDTFFFRNIAAPGSSEPEFASAVTNPFGITDVGFSANPAFADADGDGDLDLFIGNSAGNTLFFRNTAAPGATSPAFAAAETNPFGITDVGSAAKPAFADADDDGALDLFIGNFDGNTLFFRNTAPTPVAPVDSTTQDGSYGIGSVINLTVAFSETVVVDITGGTPTLQLETGSTDRKAIFVSGSGSTTLTFRYIVQEGDTSADLDQLSSTALELNGGIIADAAGNNAILTLAEPGEAGSLGDNAALVIDTTRPTGSQGSFATAPDYAAAVTNPFGITNVGSFASPAFADADNDGDLDLFIGNIAGNTLFFRNTAAPGSTTPAYATAETNPFGITDVEFNASPAFADADGDGDLDLFIGNKAGDTVFFRNTAPPGSTTPAYAAAVTNPLGITDVEFNASPAFADADGDGDLDLFIGNKDGDTVFFRNTAALGATSPAFAAAETNPFGITDVGYGAKPAFADADGDGDLDLFIGNKAGDTVFFRNTAPPGSTTPAYAAAVTNPLGITDVGSRATPAFADADGDGDLDLFIGNSVGNTLFFRNTAATPVAPVDSTTPDGTYGIGDVIDITVSFSEAVVVDTTGGTPTLQLETGTIDRKAIFESGSGSSTLTFRYTVQEGDTSADLDQLSSTALELNGGSIADAAGNNAILTLAEPGEQGSLGANAALVIDGVVPTVTGVDSTTPDGTYGIGSVINLTVSFDEIVFVTGTPALQLETGTIDGKAIFTSGSGTNTLTFQYIVQDGDSSADLDQLSSTALELNGGTIQDAAGNNAILNLPNPGAAGSLSSNADLVIDGIKPTVSTDTRTYVLEASNPFGISDVGLSAKPTFADIDGDDDLDLFIANRAGNTLFFRNTAASGSTAPAYAPAVTNPFGITDVGRAASPTLTDIDDDGDLDLFIGNRAGNTLFFRNNAAPGSTAPAYSQERGANGEPNPFGITDVGRFAKPSFTDTDNDGDLDLFIGNLRGNTLFFRNTAAAGSTAPAYAPAATNPFGINDVGLSAAPAFTDIDGDGDLDLFIGNRDGNTLVFRNNAPPGSTAPAYSQERGANGAPNPFGITDVGFNASPAFADPDNDSDPDLFIGNAAGDTIFFRNTGAAPGVNTSAINGIYTIGAVINLTIGFSKPVVVDTTGGTPTLQLETGNIDRKAVFISGSGTNTLSFQYTVQDGDTSADLDQLSSTALELNGGSITDANGNPAILSLPQPGTAGSLSDNADLIIDTNDLITSTIRSSESLTLPDGLANLILTGTANLNGTGNDLDNRIEGNSGKNRLNGKGGNDTLIGKEDKDKLTGGSDADTFLFQSINDSGITNATRDQITDFTADDTIDLSRIDADPNTNGDQAFVFIGSDRFSDIGQARFNNAVLRLNIDDDLFADFQINLKGITDLPDNSLIL
ncbi:FG-GAP-like repeat-containing protein [Synechococcus sp. A10-1-5-9]|uniref:FG-GAP-like repeat-containing protein n=1 Tax=Synechococcus sp. A10-1-5-9 TaxID=3392295 RepID=UPI0039E99BE6